MLSRKFRTVLATKRIFGSRVFRKITRASLQLLGFVETFEGTGRAHERGKTSLLNNASVLQHFDPVRF